MFPIKTTIRKFIAKKANTLKNWNSPTHILGPVIPGLDLISNPKCWAPENLGKLELFN